MVKSFTQSCRCGDVNLRIAVPRRAAGTRITCFCADCQTAAHLHQDGEDMLNAAGGTDIWQTTPDRITITDGIENLEVLRLSPKGLFRWHAACCGTPLLNTLPNLKLPFSGIVLRQSALTEAQEVFGAVTCVAGAADAIPETADAPTNRGFAKAGWAVVRRMVAAWLRGARSPLKGAGGAPVSPVRVIDLRTRQAALPDHLQKH